MSATLDGLTFVDDGGPATYTLEKIEGFLEGVEMRHESIPRPNGAGDFDAPGYLGSRLVTLTGLVLADNESDYLAALLALENLLADGSKSQLVAFGYGVDVRRHGVPDVDHVVFGRVARYMLQLWAPDPTKVVVP